MIKTEKKYRIQKILHNYIIENYISLQYSYVSFRFCPFLTGSHIIHNRLL